MGERNNFRTRNYRPELRALAWACAANYAPTKNARGVSTPGAFNLITNPSNQLE